MDVTRELLDGRPKFCFVHLNRTGGNSFWQVLEQQFDTCNEIRLYTNEARAAFVALPTVEKARYDIVGGHLAYDFDPNLPRRFQYFTLLREPVARLIAVYSDMTTRKDHVVAHRVQSSGMSILDFARCGESGVVAFAQSQLVGLGNSSKFPRDRPVSAATLFETAVENLCCNFTFVGVMERYDDSMRYLREGRGLKVNYEKVVEAKPSKKREVTKSEHDALAEILQAEIVLYQLANQILDQRLAALKKRN